MKQNNASTLVICLNDHEVFSAAKILHNRKNLMSEYYLLVNSSFYKAHGTTLEELNFTTLTYDKYSFVQDDLITSKKLVHDYIHKLNNYAFKQIVNFTYSKTACYISSAIKAPSKKGPRFDFRGNLSIRDQWSQYLYSAYDCGSPNPFSLEFLFQRILGLAIIDKKQIPVTTRPVICISITSNTSTLKVDDVSNFIYTHLKHHKNHEIALIPNSQNSNTLNAIINQDHLEFFNKKVYIVSNSSIQSTLENCLLHISDNDFDASLSSLHYRPSIFVYASNEQLLTNARLQPNSILVAKHNTSTISYNLLTECTESILKNLDPTKDVTNIPSLIVGKHKIYTTQHKQGIFLLNSVTNLNPTHDDVINEIQFYLYNLSIEDVELRSVRALDVRNIGSELSNTQQGLQFIFELAEHYQNAAETIFKESTVDKPKIAAIKKYSARIAEIEILLEQIGQKFPELQGFINCGLTYQRNIEDESIFAMAEKHILSAHQLKTLTSAFYELIESVLSRYNDKKVQQTTV